MALGDNLTATELGAGTAPSATHTPGGTPRAALVLVGAIAGSDDVTGVTYGGNAMTEVALSPLISALGNCTVHAYFLGSSIPTGAQTVTVSATGSTKQAYAITFDADADTEIADTTALDDDLANGGTSSGTLSLGGEDCVCISLTQTEDGNPNVSAPLTNWTETDNHDFGASNSCSLFTYDIVASSDVTFGIQKTSGLGTFAYTTLGIAIKEAGGGATTLTADAGTYTVTGNAVALIRSHVMAAEAGAYALTGQDAILDNVVDTGWVIAGEGASNSGIAGTAWTNPGKITAQDDDGASSTPATEYLVSSSHGFTIPAGSNIVRIDARARAARAADPNVFFRSFRIVKGGTVGTADEGDPGDLLTTGYVEYDAANVFPLWGETWTADDINDSGFGAAVSFDTTGIGSDALVDTISVKVHYQEPTHTLTAAAGAYTLTGQAAGTSRGVHLTADAGSYAYAGQAASLLWDHILAAGQGSYTYTGNAATLTVDTGGDGDTGFVIAGAGETDASFGNDLWFSQGNITADDGSNAFSNVSGTDTTRYLKSSAHGFAIPAGATIDGIEVRIQASSNNGGPTFTRVRLAKAGTVQTTDRASGSITTTPTNYDFGGASDVWGDTWSSTDINNSGFGVAVAFTATNDAIQVDAIWIRVYYTDTNTLQAASGSYVLTGQAAGTAWAHIMSVAQGSYIVSGQSAGTLWHHLLVASLGSYVVSGQAAGTLWDHSLAAGQGSYTLTGIDALTATGLLLTAAQGSYTYTGQAATTRRGYAMAVLSGEYTITGYAADFESPIWQTLPANPGETWTSEDTGSDESWTSITPGPGETWQ